MFACRLVVVLQHLLDVPLLLRREQAALGDLVAVRVGQLQDLARDEAGVVVAAVLAEGQNQGDVAVLLFVDGHQVGQNLA